MVLGQPDKNISHGRNQFVLDFGNQQFMSISLSKWPQILSNVEIDYIKLDMNRYISEAYSNMLAANQQGEVCHRYIIGSMIYMSVYR